MIHKLPADLQARYRGARVLVLGASGFIGRWVARKLTEAGAQLTLVVRDPHTAQAIFSANRVEGAVRAVDLREAAAASQVVQETRPAIVFNLAGYGVDPAERDEETAHRINLRLVETLCDCLAALPPDGWNGLQLVHTGTALEYGEIAGDLSEDSRPHPTTLYGISKLAGTETLARAGRITGLRGATARLFTVYGPGEHAGRLLPALIQAAETGRALPLTAGLQQRDFTYVEDAAEGLLRLGLSCPPPGEIINLATGRLTQVRSFAETAAQLLGIPPNQLKFGALPTRIEEMAHEPVSIARLRQHTGWAPSMPVAGGIARTIQFGIDHDLPSSRNHQWRKSI